MAVDEPIIDDDEPLVEQPTIKEEPTDFPLPAHDKGKMRVPPPVNAEIIDLTDMD